MNKNSAALAAFVDEKYIPLAPRMKLAVFILILLLPLVVFYFAWYQGKETEIQSLQARRTSLEGELRQIQAKVADLPKFEKELAAAEVKFNEAAILLPRQKEIPQLLRDISALGRNAGLDFNTFKPMPDVPQDFYSEIPISINVRGPYHNMGFFFDQVSKLERIVTVSNVRMSSPKKEAGEMLLNSECQLVTYRFTNIELPKPQK